MSSESQSVPPKQRLSCSKRFDALWFCYSPVHQMQQYYRLGFLDNCYSKWSALYDCLMLKTKPASEVEVINDFPSSIPISMYYKIILYIFFMALVPLLSNKQFTLDPFFLYSMYITSLLLGSI